MIDPLGRPHSGYEGDWWPASVVDDFATAFGGGHGSPRCGAYPPGGVPPEVVGPDVLPIPHGGGGGGPTSTPEPGESASPERERLAVDPAGHRARRPPAGDPGRWTRRSTVRRTSAAWCSSRSSRSAWSTHRRPAARRACPRSSSSTRRRSSRSRPGRRSTSCSSTRTGPTWRSSGSPSTHREPADGPLLGARRLAADDRDAVVDVVAHAVRDHGAARQPRRAGVDRVRLPGDRRRAACRVGSSPVGQFTTGNGVEQFDVALSEAVSPDVRARGRAVALPAPGARRRTPCRSSRSRTSAAGRARTSSRSGASATAPTSGRASRCPNRARAPR